MTPIRAVLFDLVGTLVTVRGSVGVQYAAVAARFGIEADAIALDAAFKAVMRSKAAIRHAGTSIEEAAETEKQWWRALVAEVFDRAGARSADDGRFDGFFEELFLHFGSSGAWEVFPDAPSALARLRGRGLLLGLVTNFDVRVYGLLRATALAHLFAAVAIPARTGAAKPDPALFRAALHELGVSPGETVHVGDSLEHDVRAATALGMTAIWLDRRSRTAPAGVQRITSLAELEILEPSATCHPAVTNNH